ncbi:hypothetical protein F7725_015286, partial [Dissostichus mawsoni]
MRKKWDSLRTKYTRYRKLAPSGSCGAQRTGRQQWILTRLQFLEPYTKRKESTMNLTITDHPPVAPAVAPAVKPRPAPLRSPSTLMLSPALPWQNPPSAPHRHRSERGQAHSALEGLRRSAGFAG